MAENVKLQMETVSVIDNHQDSSSSEVKTRLLSDSIHSNQGHLESVRERAVRITNETEGSSVLSFHDINYEVETRTSICRKKTTKHILKDVSVLLDQSVDLTIEALYEHCTEDKQFARDNEQLFHVTQIKVQQIIVQKFQLDPIIGQITCKKNVPVRQCELIGIFRPGMNAILGPTGSGKSSLLDVLAGRKDPKGLTGTILLDGSPTPHNFKCLVGYVVQDDVVMGTLTIRENFEFSATLRLPSSVTKRERKERIDQVIYELGLTEVADSKVGTEYIRGVSGGERKRCSIGMELIISPPVLFLDEPTTGLDASTAMAVMLLLKKLAVGGRNIIFSIHQPRYSIYRLFDSLMLLSHGDVAYHGKACESLDYFASVGYFCEEHNNPPDFFLDVINGDSTAVQSTSTKKVNGLIGDSNEIHIINGDSDKSKDIVITVEEKNSSLRELFRNSNWYSSVQEELKPIMSAHQKDGAAVEIKKVDYKSSFGMQLLTVSKRCVKNIVRNPQVTIMQIKTIIIYALIVGGIYFQMNKSKISGIQNREGAFFFIIMNQVFGNMSAVELFIKERAIFIHENVSGYYRVSAYFLAKVFCDVLPLRMIPVILFSVIVYFMFGLRDGADHFFFFTLNMFLTAITASTLCFAISSSVKILGLANLFLAMCYVFMMLFGGLLINVGDLGHWISWVKYLSIFRYSLNALEINELQGQIFCSNGTDCISGNDHLTNQKISFETKWDLWQNEVALVIMTATFLMLAYIQLRRIQKLK